MGTGTRMQWLTLLLAVSLSADEIQLTNGQRLAGVVRLTATGTTWDVTVPWSETPLRVKRDQVRQVELAPATNSVTPDILLGLRNSYQLPSRLKRISEQAIAVEMADGAEKVLAWDQVATVVFTQAEQEVYSSVASGWSLKGWSGATDVWDVADGQLNQFTGGEGSSKLYLPHRDDTTTLQMRLRFDWVLHARILIAKHKLRDAALLLTLENNDLWSGVQVALTDSDGSHTTTLPFGLSMYDVDLTIRCSPREITLIMAGEPVLTLPMPKDYALAPGFEEGWMARLKEVMVTRGCRFPEPAPPADPKMTTVYLANGDVVSGQAIKLQESGVRSEMYGSVVNIPWAKVTSVWLPQLPATNSSTNGLLAEIRNGDGILGVGELLSVSDNALTLRDAAGGVFAFPRGGAVTITLVTADTALQTPAAALTTFCRAMESGDVKTIRQCLLPGSAELVLMLPPMFKAGLKVEMNPQIGEQRIRGNAADLNVKFKLRSKESAGSEWETKEIATVIHLFRLDGRWRIQMGEQPFW